MHQLDRSHEFHIPYSLLLENLDVGKLLPHNQGKALRIWELSEEGVDFGESGIVGCCNVMAKGESRRFGSGIFFLSLPAFAMIFDRNVGGDGALTPHYSWHPEFIEQFDCVFVTAFWNLVAPVEDLERCFAFR